MNAPTERLTSELRDELAANNVIRIADPRSQPARFHNLAAMSKSARHCLASFSDYHDSTLAMRIGHGTHALLFGQPLTVWGGKDRRAKGYKEFADANKDSTILTRKELAHAESVAAAVRAHPQASALLFGPGTFREETIYWEQCGRKRRSTPDVYCRDYVCELKSARSAEPNKFARDGLFRGYHAQVADQIAAVEYKLGVRPKKGYIVAVETVRPFAVTVLELTDRAIDRGGALVRGWLERLLVCEASGSWPAYAECTVPFDVPDADVELVFGDDEDGEVEESES